MRLALLVQPRVDAAAVEILIMGPGQNRVVFRSEVLMVSVDSWHYSGDVVVVVAARRWYARDMSYTKRCRLIVPCRQGQASRGLDICDPGFPWST